MSSNGLDYGGIGELVASALVPVAGLTFTGAPLGLVSASAPVASVYALILDNQIDPTNCVIHAQAAGPGAGTAVVQHVADVGFFVSTFDAAEAAADRAFYVEVYRKAVS